MRELTQTKALTWKGVTIEKDGKYLRAYIKSGTEFDYEYAIEALRMRTEIEPNLKHSLYCFVEGNIVATKKGRDFTGNYLSKKLTKCIALITASNISKVTFNFFIQITKPSFPVRMFNNIEDAKKWMDSFEDQHTDPNKLNDFIEFYNREKDLISKKIISKL